VVALRVDHTDLTDEGTNVDAHVVPVEHASGSLRRVDEDLDALLVSLDGELVRGDLLSDERTNVRLEHARSETHDDDGESKDTDGSVGLGDNRGSGGGDEDNMADEGDGDGNADGLVTTPVRIGNPGTEKRDGVDWRKQGKSAGRSEENERREGRTHPRTG
jgi:hypothetical protein